MEPCLVTLSRLGQLLSRQGCRLLGLSDAVDPLLLVEGVTGLEAVALQLTSSAERNPEEVLRCERTETTEDGCYGFLFN